MTACWLIRNGVDVDRAFSMNPVEALAMAVVFGGFEGNDFDWSAMRYKERR